MLANTQVESMALQHQAESAKVLLPAEIAGEGYPDVGPHANGQADGGYDLIRLVEVAPRADFAGGRT